MDDLLETISGALAPTDTRVHVVRLRIGRDSCVSADALSFCFDVCIRGTALEGASLEILEGVGDELRLQDLEVT